MYPSIHFKILNLTLLFVFFLSVIAYLPHQKVPVLSWTNNCLYFLMFLQCVFIYRKETNNRDIFFNIGLLCFFYSFSFVNVFIGDGYLLGNDFLSFYLCQYRTILLSFLLGLSVLYICVKYMVATLSKRYVYLITFACIVPALIWSFYPFFVDKDYLLTLPDYTELFKSVFVFTLLSFVATCVYGIYLYKKQKSLGEHINSLMVCFFIMTLLDLTDSFGYVYKIKLFSISQYVLLAILSFFIITLFRKLNYVYSEFGQFYESLVVSGNKYGVPIKRKKDIVISPFLRFFETYFHHRRNILGLIALILVVWINFLHVSTFLKLNLVVAFTAFLILSGYMLALLHKRMSKDNLLSLKQHTDY